MNFRDMTYEKDIEILKNKLKEANENIETLIAEIVDMKREQNDNYCVNPKKQKFQLCNNNCDECQELFYEEMVEKLNDKYQVE